MKIAFNIIVVCLMMAIAVSEHKTKRIIELEKKLEYKEKKLAYLARYCTTGDMAARKAWEAL